MSTKQDLITDLEQYGNVLAEELVQDQGNFREYRLLIDVSGIASNPPKADWVIEEQIFVLDEETPQEQAWVSGPTKTPLLKAVRGQQGLLQIWEKIYQQNILLHSSKYASYRVYNTNNGTLGDEQHLFLNADNLTASLYPLAVPDVDPAPTRAPWCMDYVLFKRSTSYEFGPAQSPNYTVIPIADSIARDQSPDGYISVDTGPAQSITIQTQNTPWNPALIMPCKITMQWRTVVGKNTPGTIYELQLFDGETPVGNAYEAAHGDQVVTYVNFMPLVAGETHVFTFRITQKTGPAALIEILFCHGELIFYPW